MLWLYEQKACNYNPHATHPADCEFLNALTIDGPKFATVGVVTTYRYAVGSEVEWSIAGGLIVSNDGNGIIEVVWNENEALGAMLIATEYSIDGCKGLDARLLVERSIETASTMFSMFPNPANEVLTISLTTTDAILMILDGSGRTIDTRKINDSDRIQIDLSDYANGTYTVVISNESTRTVKPLVIAH